MLCPLTGTWRWDCIDPCRHSVSAAKDSVTAGWGAAYWAVKGNARENNSGSSKEGGKKKSQSVVRQTGHEHYCFGLVLPEKLRVASMVVRMAPWGAGRGSGQPVVGAGWPASFLIALWGLALEDSRRPTLTLSFLLALNFFRQSTVSCLCMIDATVDRCCEHGFDAYR